MSRVIDAASRLPGDAPRRSEDNAASQVLTPGAVAGEAQSVGSAGGIYELEVTTPLARILSHKTAPTYRCPDCDGPFSYRFRDEDTGCSYPVDDGEHYCARCDAIWTDDYLDFEPLVDVERLGPGRVAV